jgi:flagellar hook-associated protein FlgK
MSHKKISKELQEDIDYWSGEHQNQIIAKLKKENAELRDSLKKIHQTGYIEGFEDGQDHKDEVIKILQARIEKAIETLKKFHQTTDRDLVILTHRKLDISKAEDLKALGLDSHKNHLETITAILEGKAKPEGSVSQKGDGK